MVISLGAVNVGSAQSCFGATATEISFTSSGGTLNRSIQHSCSGGTFSLGTYPSWLTSVTISGETVTAVAPAYSGAERSGSIQLLYNGSTSGGIAVVQNEGQTPPPPPCIVSGFGGGGSFDGAGETRNYTISYSNCSSQSYFTFADDQGNPLPSWITISQPSTTQVNVTFAANNTGSARSLVIVGTSQSGNTPGIGNTFSQSCFSQTWYADSDDDGFRDPGGASQQSCGEPSGGNWTTSTIDDNCPNDYNLTNISKTWYADSDGDGFRDANGNTVVQCSEPSGNWTDDSTVDNCPNQPFSTNNGCDPNCTPITWAPNELNFDENGGNGSVTVTVPVNCTPGFELTVTNVPTWIQTSVTNNVISVTCDPTPDSRQISIPIHVNGSVSGGFLVKQNIGNPPAAAAYL